MPTQRKHRRGLKPLADAPLQRTSVNEKADALLVAIRSKSGTDRPSPTEPPRRSSSCELKF